jgi:hypothetical protein
MNKCEKCQNMARFVVSGAVGVHYLCASHAMILCESVGDRAGVEHFSALLEGDRLPIGA